MRLPPADKLAHAVVGAAVAMFAALLHIASVEDLRGDDIAATAIAVALGAALGREAYNRRTGGVWSWADIAATLVGGALVALPLAALV